MLPRRSAHLAALRCFGAGGRAGGRAGGGRFNSVYEDGGVVAAGDANTIATGAYAVLAGGHENTIYGDDFTTIAGGGASLIIHRGRDKVCIRDS